MLADLESIVTGDNEPGGDGVVLTRLAQRLVERIPDLCVLKTFYDGRESVPTSSIPQGQSARALEVYKRFVSICPLNLAHAVADAVSDRQKPTGFRSVADTRTRATDADAQWRKDGMPIRSRDMFSDVAVYGMAFALVSEASMPSHVNVLSPWKAMAGAGGDNAIVYRYDMDALRESFTLYRVVRDGSGVVSNVYWRTAERDAPDRTIPSESDEEQIYRIANNEDGARLPSLPNDFQWTGAASSKGLEFAKTCGLNPVVCLSSRTGKGQFEPHLPLLSAIDQQRFQRIVIQEMQAFRQRAISGDLPLYYTKEDEEVRLGLKSEGDEIDYSSMFEMSPAALWRLPKDAKMWESSTTDTSQLTNSINDDVKKLAAVSGTPLDILSPDVQGSANGAELKREGLTFKVQDLNARANEAFIAMMRMSLTIDGKHGDEEDYFETTWQPISTGSDLEQSQSAAQVKGILPVKTIMRNKLHMTEIDIAQAEQDLTDTAFANALSAEWAKLDAKTTAQTAPTLDEGGSTGVVTADVSGAGAVQMSDVAGAESPLPSGLVSDGVNA